MPLVGRYILSGVGEIIIEMPEESKILSVQDRDGTISIWATIDTNKPPQKRKFLVIGTGAPFEGENLTAYRIGRLQYLATIQLRGLVWHIFENLLKA